MGFFGAQSTGMGNIRAKQNIPIANKYTQEVKNEYFFLVSTRQNNVLIFDIRCLKATNGHRFIDLFIH